MPCPWLFWKEYETFLQPALIVCRVNLLTACLQATVRKHPKTFLRHVTRVVCCCLWASWLVCSGASWRVCLRTSWRVCLRTTGLCGVYALELHGTYALGLHGVYTPGFRDVYASGLSDVYASGLPRPASSALPSMTRSIHADSWLMRFDRCCGGGF